MGAKRKATRPAPKRKARPKAEEPKEPKLAGVVGGEARLRKLDQFAPNPWNPNVLTTDEFEGLKEVLRTKGWARSDALLVWGANEDGKRQDLIINGEHRWRAAREIGMTLGPVVELNGISRAEAVAWTIRLDKIRGQFDPDKLRLTLGRELDFRNAPDSLALSLGFSAQEVLDLRVQIPAMGGRPPNGGGHPPDDFPAYGHDIETTHRCPSCGYEWSGQSKVEPSQSGVPAEA